jgi:hypothetical protein
VNSHDCPFPFHKAGHDHRVVPCAGGGTTHGRLAEEP